MSTSSHGAIRERRVRRSRNKRLALEYLLAARVLRAGLHGVVLGTRDGLLMAAAGHGVDPEAAAAFAPFVFHDKWDFPEAVDGAYFVDVIPLPDTTLYLFVVGPGQEGSPGVRQTKEAIRRILNESSAPAGAPVSCGRAPRG